MEPDFQRPWGRLGWVVDRLPPEPWHLIGCLNTEERCLKVLDELGGRGLVASGTLLNIAEHDGHPQEAEIRQLKADRQRTLDGLLQRDGYPLEISEHRLLERYNRIVETARAVASTQSRIWLDMSSLPKRFFFPLLKMFLRTETVTDIVVTYTSAKQYAPEELHQDALSPDYLPLFGPSVDGGGAKAEGLVIGLGFESPGLIQILEASDYAPVVVLFPYPAPPPYFGRNWDFLRQAVRSIDRTHLSISGVSSKDVPTVYRRLGAIMADSNVSYVCAPYGPKPVSLAMCLFAARRPGESVAMLYTQPKYYAAAYSIGIAEDREGAVINTYPIRLNGRNLY